MELYIIIENESALDATQRQINAYHWAHRKLNLLDEEGIYINV